MLTAAPLIDAATVLGNLALTLASCRHLTSAVSSGPPLPQSRTVALNLHECGVTPAPKFVTKLCILSISFLISRKSVQSSVFSLAELWSLELSPTLLIFGAGVV